MSVSMIFVWPYQENTCRGLRAASRERLHPPGVIVFYNQDIRFPHVGTWVWAHEVHRHSMAWWRRFSGLQECWMVRGTWLGSHAVSTLFYVHPDVLRQPCNKVADGWCLWSSGFFSIINLNFIQSSKSENFFHIIDSNRYSCILLKSVVWS